MITTNIICLIVLGSFVVLPILALVLSILVKQKVGADGKIILGLGPRCDICGEYLSEHTIYQCETYC